MNFTDMVDAHLDVRSRTGTEWLALCPFHDDTSPSLHVNTQKEVFICFACGAAGGSKSLIQALGASQLDPPRLHGPELRQRIQEVFAEEHPVRVYPDEWLALYDHDHDYWKSRGFSPLTIQRFNLGYDMATNCMTIPIRTATNRVLGVIRRRLDDERPKYKYPPGFAASKHLFGSWMVGDRVALTKVALCEGPLDAVAMWDAGCPAVAMYGSRLSKAQSALLQALGVRSVVVTTDQDDAGRQAQEQVLGGLSTMVIRLAQYPREDAKDPGELTRGERRSMHESAPTIQECYLRVGA